MAAVPNVARVEAQVDSLPPIPGSLSLSDALARALDGNPLLRTHHWDVEAAAGRIRQAGLRPNPGASFEIFELGGKRGARLRAARTGEGLAKSDFDHARLEVASLVIRRYFEMLAAQEGVTLADESIAIADEIRTSVGRRVEAGALPPAERTRAGIEFENAVLGKEVAEQDLALGRIRLASLWGETRPPAFRAGIDDTRPPSVPGLDSLMNELSGAPRVARSRRELLAREAELDLARSGRLPDVELEAGYRNLRESGDGTFVAGVTLPLPLFHRNQGDIAEARALVSRALADVRREEIELSRQLSEVHTALTLAGRRAEALRNRIVPGAGQAWEEIRTGYERGRFSYVDLLEARRAWTEARRQEVEATLQYHLAVAEAELLLGRSLIHPGVESREEERR
jgi:cobalt-zinc-cadmium efflux system outer membrane protein